MLLALLFACEKTYAPACETESFEVGDAEPLGETELTVEGLVSQLSGRRTASVRDVDGALRALSLEALRAAGAALWTEATPTTTVTTRLGFGESYLLIAAQCDDTLSVPMSLIAESEDGAVAIEEEATLFNPGELAEEDVWMEVNAGLSGDAVLPGWSGAPPAALAAQYQRGTLRSISAYTTDGDYLQLLEWP